MHIPSRALRRLFIATGAAVSVGASAGGDFKIFSDSWKEGERLSDDHVLNGMSCRGKDLSPDVRWENPPEGTQSFAVTVYDPDAPTGSGWWHWTLFNVPADVRGLSKGASSLKTLPEGAIEGMTDFGRPGFGGACPPPGSPHRYVLSVHALRSSLPLDDKAPPAMLGFHIRQNELARQTITALYSR